MKVSVLGSTGSIGTQTLEVLSALGHKPVCLAAKRNTVLMESQARQYRPRLVAIQDRDAARELRVRLADTDIRVEGGDEGLLMAAVFPEADTVLTAVVGMSGLKPTLAAITERKTIALANKETLVCAGSIVMGRAKEAGVRILPVDSEHSAVFQCLEACRDGELSKIWLTASGGPFFGWTPERLHGVTPGQAVSHPNWSMGAKVSVDSATMLNKGLECIEARHLFGLEPEQIGVVVHRQSIVHALVEFCDGALLAQCAAPDMRLPIQFALTWPHGRKPCPAPALDMSKAMSWDFAPPDLKAFPCLSIALEALRRGDAACCALNAAGEVAVELFLAEKIGFMDIPGLLEKAVFSAVTDSKTVDLERLLDIDGEIRGLISGIN